jgi:transposase
VAKQELAGSALAHADETSINLDGKKIWLHNLPNSDWAWFAPHEKRGAESMNAIGIIPVLKKPVLHNFGMMPILLM